MTVSIFNRVMAVGLATVGVIALVWWLVAAASGPDAYAYFMSWATHWFGYLVMVGLSFVFFFHLCAGLRHFVMDAGAGFELQANRAWAWATVVAAVVLTGGMWLIIAGKGLN
jgi:succinate dehydrogenase / fumarate reductase, cytochrome b subunit